MPLAVQQAVTACETKRADAVAAEINKLRDATQSLNGCVAASSRAETVSHSHTPGD